MPRVYLDSCVVIYLREGTPEQRTRLHERMTTASAGGGTFSISELVRFECRVGPLKRADSSLLADYEAFFSLDELIVAPIERAVFDRAAEMRAATGTQNPRCASRGCGGDFRL